MILPDPPHLAPFLGMCFPPFFASFSHVFFWCLFLHLFFLVTPRQLASALSDLTILCHKVIRRQFSVRIYLDFFNQKPLEHRIWFLSSFCFEKLLFSIFVICKIMIWNGPIVFHIWNSTFLDQHLSTVLNHKSCLTCSTFHVCMLKSIWPVCSIYSDLKIIK